MAGRISYYGSIVTNGLILDLDAAKKDSYPGSGTLWSDISGFQNNGILTNGPTFNSDNGGNIVLDGINDFVNCGNSIDLRSGFTFEFWTKPNNFSPEYGMLGQGPESTNRGLHISYVPGPRGMVFAFYFNDADYGNNYIPTVGVWYHWVFTYNGTTFAKQFYANTVLQTPVSIVQNNYIGTGQLNIGGIFSSAIQRMNGRIGCARLYNRPLTSQQIIQNYNAVKGRYL